MKELLLRILTGILLIVLVAGSILIGPIPFLGVLILVYGLGLRELLLQYQKVKEIHQWILTLSGILLFPLTYAIFEHQWNLLWLLLPVALWAIGTLRFGLNHAGMLSLFWLAIPLTCFQALGWQGEANDYHPLIPLSVISLVWINDTFAYVTGSLLGKHKMTPLLSPGKTWEGFTGGIVFTLIGGWFIFKITGQYSAVSWIFFAMLISVLSFAGDLFESGLKRRKNIKNMGEILPGHGGILDRFDSLLFVAPGMMILLFFLKLIQ